MLHCHNYLDQKLFNLLNYFINHNRLKNLANQIKKFNIFILNAISLIISYYSQLRLNPKLLLSLLYLGI